MDNKYTITMMGTGYVGLVTALCFAELGIDVLCYDKDLDKINQIKQGNIPIFEPMLAELIEKHLSTGRLNFADTLSQAITQSQIIFIAVGTPTNSKTGQADLCFIEQVAVDIAPYLEAHKTIVVKSTVPVGTGQHVKKIIQTHNPKANFDMVSNPEFLREGSGVFDFMNPDRIVIGSESETSRERMNRLYQAFTQKNVPILHSNIETAEMIKYAANCFLATRIAFVNEISNLCEQFEADVENVMLAVGLDKRIGSSYLKPGPGFGGSCFPKDTLALRYMAQSNQISCQILDAVIDSNESRKKNMIDKIIQACDFSVADKTIAILGVAFKANTDDVRDSAALTVIQGLQQLGAKLRVFDPKAMEKARQIVPNVYWAKDSRDAIEHAQMTVILTEWDIFTRLDLKEMYHVLLRNTKQPTLVDLRNLYTPSEVEASGLRYISLGRPIRNSRKVLPEVLSV